MGSDLRAQAEQTNWLIYDKRSECYWGPNRGGYFKSLTSAGLYTEKEAKAAEDFANRYDRAEIAVPLERHREAIERLYHALNGESALRGVRDAERQRCAAIARKAQADCDHNAGCGCDCVGEAIEGAAAPSGDRVGDEMPAQMRQRCED